MSEIADPLLTEMKQFYEGAKQAGRGSIRWEELPQMVRFYIRSKYGFAPSTLTAGAFYQIIKEYEESLKAKSLPPIELSEEERAEMRKVIEESSEAGEEPAEAGKDEYQKLVQDIADFLSIYVEEAPRPGEVAEVLIEKLHFATMSDTEELYLYEGGVYRPTGEAFIKRLLQEAFSKAGMVKRLSSYFIKETIEHVKRATLRSRSEFDRDLYTVNVRNGLLDLRTLELKPHDPDYLSVIQLPVEWNPRAQCPRFDQFIQEIVDPDDAPVLQEFAGYALWRDCRFQKALMLTGSGANGKTTFLNILIKVLGRQNLAFHSLQDLTTSRFASADLYGKLANIYDDLPPTKIINAGLFKILVTGGEIQAEKKFKPSFRFRNYAKLIFSANKIPSSIDDTRAFFRRWIIINFPNEFTGDRVDRHLEEKLSTPECLSYVLKWAVEGLKRLLEAGAFSNEDSIDAVEEKYLKASNPAYAFITARVVRDQAAAVSKDDLYHAFLDYCKQNKLPSMSKRAFAEEVKKWTRATDGWMKKDGRAVRAWRGIKLADQGLEAWGVNEDAGGSA